MGSHRRFVLWVAFQMALTVGLLEVGLRVLRPHSATLRSLLYLPTIRTEFSAATTTEELLALTFHGHRPRETRCGFVLNSRGFRTPEYEERKAPGTARIVVLGDSFAYASGCLPWSRLWHTRLGAALGPGVEVINLGIPSVGPRFELRMWELEGARLRPDVVVIAIFVGNDFDDERVGQLEPRRFVQWSHVYRLTRNLARIVSERLGEDSSAPAFVPDAPAAAKGGFEVPGWDRSYDPLAPSMRERTYLRMEWDRLRITDKSRRDRFEASWSELRAVLGQLHEAVTSQGAELLVAIVPDEYQVDPELLARVLEEGEASADDFDIELPQRKLVEFLSGAGILHVDLLPAFRERTREERLYRLRDSHWNAEGNALAASILAEALRDRIPPTDPTRRSGR